jgi:hypothetical protein
MTTETPRMSLEGTGKVYTNEIDKYYHQTVLCVLRLPTEYQEKQLEDARKLGLKPCKRCNS